MEARIHSMRSCACIPTSSLSVWASCNGDLRVFIWEHGGCVFCMCVCGIGGRSIEGAFCPLTLVWLAKFRSGFCEQCACSGRKRPHRRIPSGSHVQFLLCEQVIDRQEIIIVVSQWCVGLLTIHACMCAITQTAAVKPAPLSAQCPPASPLRSWDQCTSSRFLIQPIQSIRQPQKVKCMLFFQRYIP